MTRSSAARPFQAEAAASIGAEPGPEYIRAELISGGSVAKSRLTVIAGFFLYLAVMALAAVTAEWDAGRAWVA
ncbi:hypothetical protein MMRN_27680 [Mycobacterium marinum]|uniref:Uncharacterized protein n=1 Tax=Mycobacterium shottsii TaxID=133549 RepID=A0A7I7LF55_9MYCO|nr:hypothetical protein MMRN_27680 [Mycobacterium marinum]BBX58661.1 hypothetical protein MSHO_40060 [Mycobacterium shottsii]GJO02691.1 hypothetical protein NJB1808e29_26180 [Mycobacterium marinum]GJP07384.1 hypothetical protein NJB18001_33100 [Mycobacterium marinum]GJP26497.1 hypothetical protein NJB1808_43460 [Mycobacterium marinum]